MFSYPTLSLTQIKIICILKVIWTFLSSPLFLSLSLSPSSLSSSPLLSWIPPLTTWHICEDKRFSKVLVIGLKINRCTVASRCKISYNITPVLFLKINFLSSINIFYYFLKLYLWFLWCHCQNNWIKFAII